MQPLPSTQLDGWLDEDFIPVETAASYFRQLYEEIPWQQDQIQLFGRSISIPRLQAFMGEAGLDYRYSGLSLSAIDWHPAVAEIRDRLLHKTEVQFNAVLLNLYRDGHDSMGWHRDDEPELGSNPVIASISLGAQRRFLMRTRDRERYELQLNSGALLWMGPSFQNQCQHSLPKTKKPVTARINLTFRKIQI
ncbi:alpha-ketoglutarate-dependent dioxygenase AlkB [uncultured Neptuniibacter sp.]|uniref:alpha-ketoglutarate-dependent dioxygenase AlkB family protein n=1 Tax=uncultured Neptuniibacter sp. TaxID=502143 RepID=UPI0026128F78|nr:alpha-ketoglutarate-dependent dioxygenase AlkB [uncultured Neptuniibacter sp.]